MAFNNGDPWTDYYSPQNVTMFEKYLEKYTYFYKIYKEETMTEANVTLDKLKAGDQVRFYYEDEVTSVSTVTGFARTKSGARIRMTNGTGLDAVSNGTCFKADRLEKPKKDFKAGQVWKDAERTYMMIGGAGGVKAYDTQDVMYAVSALEKKSDLTMVFGG